MNIIIAGAGRVGYRLASTLSHRHNVTIIDRRAAALQQLQESIDVFTIAGDIENPDTYLPLKQRRFDIFIAVTDSDEANILSTLIAGDVIEADTKIIRLKNPYFADSTIAGKLGISSAVFPFSSAARSISALLDYPQANNVKSFIYSPFQMVSVYVESAPGTGIPVSEFVHETCVVVGLERDKHFSLPDGESVLYRSDLVYFFGDPETIRAYCARLNPAVPDRIDRVAIFDAGQLGLEIAKALIPRGVKLKIIDKHLEKCERASEQLQDKAAVINSHYIEHTLFDNEHAGRADLAIFTSEEDEENIIRCLEAKEHGIPRTVAINNDIERYGLMHSLGIIPMRGPKSSAYYAILEAIGSSSIISERHYCGGRGIIYSRKIFSDSPLLGKLLPPPDPKRCRSFLLRDNLLLPWVAKLQLHEDDVLFVFLDAENEEAMKRWIYTL
ncbi:NAD-binding protein [Thiomicrolovo sp. ZZH C-3]